MKAGYVYIVQCPWRHAVAVEVEHFDPMTGRIACSRICTIRIWRNNAGLEGVALLDPWDDRVTLEMPKGPAGPGHLNWFQTLFNIEAADQPGWKARLRGEAKPK